tara:strand:- start:181 stop:366 length:186 start_codon:yes stop_codon:yes gene_type:complete
MKDIEDEIKRFESEEFKTLKKIEPSPVKNSPYTQKKTPLKSREKKVSEEAASVSPTPLESR